MKRLSPGIVFFFVGLIMPYPSDAFSRPLVGLDRTKLYTSALQTTLSPWSVPKADPPEHHIGPVLRYGLDLVLPQPVRKGFDLDAGYDRWSGLPTLTADCFFPVRAWNDKSLFVTPRCSLTGNRESFSLGAGLRHLITSDSLVGFYAFHDWVRPRGSTMEFLKQAGVGAELAALPGNFSDLSISVNAYFPVNERWTPAISGDALIRETLPGGADLKLGFLLPALVDGVDIRLNAQTHAYRGARTNLTGYRWGLSGTTRNGMLTGTFEHGRENDGRDHIRIHASISLAFDWCDLLKGEIPFSAPYETPSRRFSRQMHNGLYERVVRKHDLPTDRDEKRFTLGAAVHGERVRVTGGFPGLRNAAITVQTASSPWRDRVELTTDSRGSYSGQLQLPPGTYKIRLVHKPTGLVSEERTITIEEQ